MSNPNLKQIYDRNPSTILPETALIYSFLSPFSNTDSTGITIANLKQQFSIFSSPNLNYKVQIVLDNDGDLNFTSDGTNPINSFKFFGNIFTTQAILATRGASFGDDVAMLNGKKMGFFGPGNANLATINVLGFGAGEGNLSFNCVSKFQFNNDLDLTNHNIDNVVSVSASNFNTQGIMTWNESGVRAFTATASGGDLVIASNDALGSVSFSGLKITNLGDPTLAEDAVNLDYVSNNFYANNITLDEIALANADLSLNSKKITNLSNGVSSTDAATVGQLSGYLPSTTSLNSISVPTGTVNFNNQNLSNIGTLDSNNLNAQGILTLNQSGVRFFTATASGGDLVINSNDALGSISVSGLKIKNLSNGVSSTDAATVGQLPVISALNSVYYVSKTGNDATGSGSQSAPYATVNAVLNLIPSNNTNYVTIYIAPGLYTENIVVSKQRVNIVGMQSPSAQPKGIKFPSISITTIGSNTGNYVDNGVSISNITFYARSGLETYAILYTASNLFLSLNNVLISNDANINGIGMDVADSSRLYINNSSINVSGTAVGLRFIRGELWDFRNSSCSSEAECIITNSNNVVIYSAINSSFTSTSRVFNFTGSNNKGVIGTFSQCLIQGSPTGTSTTDAMIQLGASCSISFNNCSLVNAGGNAQVGNAIVYLGSSSVLLLTYSSVSTTATNNLSFIPFKSQTANNSIFQYYGNVFLTAGANTYVKPVSGIGGFLLVSKMATDS